QHLGSYLLCSLPLHQHGLNTTWWRAEIQITDAIFLRSCHCPCYFDPSCTCGGWYQIFVLLSVFCRSRGESIASVYILIVHVFRLVFAIIPGPRDRAVM